MSNYSSLPSKSEEAKFILKENYELLDSYFTQFMEDMLQFVEQEHGVKIKKPDFSTGL